MQADWARGPLVKDRETNLFCGWLPRSGHRVIFPTWDRTQGTLLSCVDRSLRRFGGGAHGGLAVVDGAVLHMVTLR